MKALALVLLGVAAVHAAVEWVEPAFVETAATSKLRGVSHTVAPHRGMVTYISPARHVQTSGIVLTPPPSVSVVEAALPRPQVLIQPVVFERGLADAYDAPYAAQYIDDRSGLDVPTQVEHDLEYAHNAMFGTHSHHADHLHVHPHAHAHAHAHATHMHHGVDVPAIEDDDHGHVHGRHHHLPHVDVHNVHAPHHHHASFHPVFPVHADLHIPGPVAVPESLYLTPYHQPHVDHASPISFGSIRVPHDSHGAIALEEPEYTGYNPGPVVVPHHTVRVVHRTDPALPEKITYTVPRVVREYPLK